jgi:site-specific DNA-methyltransferase (adenine-specific)
MRIRTANKLDAQPVAVRGKQTSFSFDRGLGAQADGGGNVLRFSPFNLNLPAADNTAEALRTYRHANAILRNCRSWPAPYNKTTHHVSLGDARNLREVDDASVHLIVTSPPYWTLKSYGQGSPGQLGLVNDYEAFVGELDNVWRESLRVLVPGGRMCIVVGDVCVSRKEAGRHYVLPLHADIQIGSRKVGFDVLTPIIWSKVANGARESKRSSGGFYGKPYQPNGVIKNDHEFVLLMRKGGEYRKIEPLQKVLSMLSEAEMQLGFRSTWSDIPGASTENGHPAPYPVALAERLIRIFSFAGDIVLDPFCGSGTTAVASILTGRNSLSHDIEREYVFLAAANMRAAAEVVQETGATSATIIDNALIEANRAGQSGIR